MRRKVLTDRERKRIATRRQRQGDDFEVRNARYAAQFNKTKFTSATGRKAAFRKHELDRIRKAEKLKEIQEDE